MKTELGLLVLALAATAVIAEIDWNDYKPVTHYEKFWDNKPAALRPSKDFFEKNSRSSRIVGGGIAHNHEFPYQVALLIFLTQINGVALCGGSVLNQNYVLTAAHCVDTTLNGNIVFGAQNLSDTTEAAQFRRQIDASHIRAHPQWDPALIRNDIALIRIPTPIVYSAAVQPIVLPTANDGDFTGERGVVSGWGRFADNDNRSSDVLRFAYGSVMTHLACSIRFFFIVQTSNICMAGDAGGSACSGDSGGPFTVQRDGRSTQIGVVSFGLALGCELGWPSVFARTTAFVDWIHATAVI